VLLLLLWGFGEGGWGGAADRERSLPAEESALEAAAAAAHREGGPRLEAGPGATARATHGPVLVRVLDPRGAPCAGVRVESWTAPEKAAVKESSGQKPEEVPHSGWNPEAPTPPHDVLRTLTDAAGVARFADLPYDGRAEVRVRSRLNETEEQERESVRDGMGAWAEAGAPPVFTFRLALPAREGAPEGQEAPVTADSEEMKIEVIQPPPPDLLAKATVEGPEVTLTIDPGLPLSVDVREGGAGRLRRDAPVLVRPRVPWASPPTGDTRVQAKPGHEVTIRCRAQAPEGWVARLEAAWLATIHPLATRLHAVYPLRPAVDVIVEFPQEVMPYRAEDWAGEINVAGVTLEAPDLHVDGRGHLRVRGGAHLVGDSVTVSGTLGTRWSVQGVGIMGSDPRQPVRVVARAEPRAPPTPTVEHANEPIQIDLGPAFSGKSFVLGDSAFMKVLVQNGRDQTERRAQETSHGPLPLRVIGWDGAPAAGAHVPWLGQVHVADAQGRVVLEGVPTGTHPLQVLGAGAPLSLSVGAGPLPRAEQVVTATAGGTLEVEVVDALGRALPYAHVALVLPGELPVMDCVDGLQRIDPYTDAAGRRTYRFVPPGKVTVKAWFGTRSSEVQVEVMPGAPIAARVVLPVHEAPAGPETDDRAR
jgi:hypothetical protein